MARMQRSRPTPLFYRHGAPNLYPNTRISRRDPLNEDDIGSLRERWARHHEIKATTFTALATELQDLCEPIRDALVALETKEELSGILRRTPGAPEPEWSDPASLLSLGETLAANRDDTPVRGGARPDHSAAPRPTCTTPARARRPRPDLGTRAGRCRGAQRVGVYDCPATRRGQPEKALDHALHVAGAYTTARQHAADNVELSRLLHRKRELLIESSQAVSDSELRELLVEEIERQGKEFGLLFTEIAGGFTFTGRMGPQVFQVTPIMVYRVYADGRPDELVRGADLIGTPLISFSGIIATGTEREVFNGFCGAESGMVPVSGVAPAILTAQIEIQKKPKAADRPPLLPRPEREGR